MTPSNGIEYLKKLSEDEPVFILRARDKFAPSTVGCWAAMCLSQNARDQEGNELYPETLVKGKRAQDLAEEMRQWQKKNQVKVPD